MVIQDHQANLYTCAKEFRSLCLQRTVLRSLQQFAILQKNSYVQKANVRALYAANLRAKLFRFLHASNIEFI